MGDREPAIGRGKEDGLRERVTWLGAVGVAWKEEDGGLEGIGEEEEEYGG